MTASSLRRTVQKAVAATALLLATAGASAAVLVYNNPMAAPFAGLMEATDTTRIYSISAFTLGSTVQLQQAVVYIGGTSQKLTGDQDGLDNWTGDVLYRFYADDGGRPGSVVASGTGAVLSLLPTDREWYLGKGNPVFQLLFEFESLVDIAASELMWFGVGLVSTLDPLPTVSDLNYDLSPLGLMDGASDAGKTFQVRSTDAFFSGDPIRDSFAFALLATQGKPGDPTAIPLPATLPLVLGGLGLLGASGSFRRRVSQ